MAWCSLQKTRGQLCIFGFCLYLPRYKHFLNYRTYSKNTLLFPPNFLILLEDEIGHSSFVLFLYILIITNNCM